MINNKLELVCCLLKRLENMIVCLFFFNIVFVSRLIVNDKLEEFFYIVFFI